MDTNRRWFGAVTADVALDPAIKPTAKALYVVLACYADHDGECWPSVERLAKHLGVGRRTVHSALQELETHGVLSRTARFNDEGRQTSNTFRLLDSNAVRSPKQSRARE